VQVWQQSAGNSVRYVCSQFTGAETQAHHRMSTGNRRWKAASPALALLQLSEQSLDDMAFRPATDFSAKCHAGMSSMCQVYGRALER
jgi:hypothetical protein